MRPSDYRTPNHEVPVSAAYAAMTGLGVALPPRVVTNADIAEHAEVDDAWIVRRTGIRERRYAAEGDRLVDLASAAAVQALRDAEVDAASIDLVIVATATADDVLPNAAPGVAHAIGATGAGAFDLGAACAGFVTACAQAAGWIESGRGRRVLVIGAEILSRRLDRCDSKTAPLFGDGAGAVVIERSDHPGIGPSLLRSDGARADALVIDGVGGILRMDGQATFRAAVAALCEVSTDVCRDAGISLQDIGLFVFHQANARILTSVADQLGVGRERVIEAIATVGNTSAASVPLALSAARDAGRLLAGRRMLLAGVGAGFTYSALLCSWSGRD
jgi:3-oxoacyl-[acyl-carrier-protein] synthase-3